MNYGTLFQQQFHNLLLTHPSGKVKRCVSTLQRGPFMRRSSLDKLRKAHIVFVAKVWIVLWVIIFPFAESCIRKYTRSTV